MGRKESNQTNKKHFATSIVVVYQFDKLWISMQNYYAIKVVPDSPAYVQKVTIFWHVKK